MSADSFSGERYAHISEVTASIRGDIADARERLLALETYVFKARSKEIEELGKRVDRLRDNLKSVKNVLGAVLVGLLGNFIAVIAAAVVIRGLLK